MSCEPDLSIVEEAYARGRADALREVRTWLEALVVECQEQEIDAEIMNCLLVYQGAYGQADYTTEEFDRKWGGDYER